MSKCKNCLKPISGDEAAMTKKLISRASTEFYCYECLAELFRCSTDLLKEKAAYFKESGCQLF